MLRRPRASTLFPYTTLFRSARAVGRDRAGARVGAVVGVGVTEIERARVGRDRTGDGESTRLNCSDASSSCAGSWLDKRGAGAAVRVDVHLARSGRRGAQREG